MRVILHETVSGNYVDELDFLSASWSTGICRADSVTVSAAAYLGKYLRPYMVPGKFTLTLVTDDGVVRASAVLGKPEAQTDDVTGNNVIEFPGNGVETLFRKRHVLPANFWPLIDSQGYPISSRDTYVENVEYGTMMKRLYQLGTNKIGSELPLSFEPDRVGTRRKGWTAVDGKPIQDAVEDISELVEGVEWDWVPILDDNDNLTWHLSTGTDSTIEITSDFVHTWQSGGEYPDIKNFSSSVSPEFMNSVSIFSGGKDGDRVMFSRETSVDLAAAGIPYIEVWDTSHSSVSEQSTLDGWAKKSLEEGSAPVEYWGFDVRVDSAPNLRHGDWCTLEMLDHWLIPDGSYPRRIIEVRGTDKEDWYQVTVAGELSW